MYLTVYLALGLITLYYCIKVLGIEWRPIDLLVITILVILSPLVCIAYWLFLLVEWNEKRLYRRERRETLKNDLQNTQIEQQKVRYEKSI